MSCNSALGALSSTDVDEIRSILRERVDAYRQLGKVRLSFDQERIAKAETGWRVVECRRMQFERPSTD